MKKLIRPIAVALCVFMMASVFYGCSITFDVTLNKEGGSSGGSVAVNASATAAQTNAPATTAAPVSTPETQAPATTADAAATSESENSDATTATSGELSSSSSIEEIVAEYAAVYNATKATGTFLGHDTMVCESVTIDGKEQGALKSLAGKFLAADGTNMPLPPYTDDNPSNECLITADDVESATYADNSDGTATIKIVPKEVVNSKRFSDAQGKMFNVMEDVASGLAGIPVISWSEGDANSNTTLTTKEGYAEITYSKDTKIMTKADYVLVTYADVQHCNVTIFKDKSGGAKFVYTMSYPG